MKRILLGTTALAVAGAMAAGTASAADMLSVGVGGYMQQWMGFVDRDDMGEDGGAAAQSDSEIFIKGSLESDMGLKFSVHVEVEGDRGNHIDESYLRVSGDFGDVEIGARDHAMVRMHQGISDVGIGLTSGDTQKWVPGSYLETAGHAIGNARKINYITPRYSGLQVGVSYSPDDTTQAAVATPNGNDNAGWGVAANYKQDVGDMAVTLSAGHASRDQMGATMMYMSGEAAGTRLTVAQHKAHMDAIEDYAEAALAAADGNLQALQAAAVDAATAIENATDMSAAKADAKTYSNFGIGVGMGAWGFNVAYAVQDGGAYKLATHHVDPNPAGQETETEDDDIVTQRLVKDTSQDYDVLGVSVSWSEGPVSISLGHMAHEADDGGERTATMLSGSYVLAPGIAWKTSAFVAEDTTAHKNVTGGMNEGAAFVTGIALSF